MHSDFSKQTWVPIRMRMENAFMHERETTLGQMGPQNVGLLLWDIVQDTKTRICQQ